MTLAAALAGALVISFSAIFFALSGADPITGIFFRAAYALPAVFALWFARRRRDRRSPRKRLIAFGAGVALGLDIAMWHSSINYIGTGLATLLVGSQAIFVAVFAWLFLGEIPSKRVMATVPLVLIGVGLVSGVGQKGAFGANPLRGAALALLAAVFYAVFILGYQSVQRRKGSRSRTSNGGHRGSDGRRARRRLTGIRHQLHPGVAGAWLAAGPRPRRPGCWLGC